MRTFTDISDDRLLVVLPGAELSEFLRSLESTMQANQAMQDFYSQHKARFPQVEA
jgi:lipid A disaccharide synthetase